MNWNKFAFEYKLETEGILSDVISIEAHKQSAQNLVLLLIGRDNWIS